MSRESFPSRFKNVCHGDPTDAFDGGYYRVGSMLHAADSLATVFRGFCDQACGVAKKANARSKWSLSHLR